jgi:hypothetical protein
MAYIPRQAKSPARVAITCRLPADIAKLLKQYAEFLDSSQEHILSETLRVAFRRDKEFQAWLTTRNAPGNADSGTSQPTTPSASEPALGGVGDRFSTQTKGEVNRNAEKRSISNSSKS